MGPRRLHLTVPAGSVTHLVLLAAPVRLRPSSNRIGWTGLTTAPITLESR